MVNPPSQQIQAGVSLRQKIDTPEFWGLSFDEKKYVMDGLDQDFAGLSDEEKTYVLSEFEKTPSPQQGVQNLMNAATGAVQGAVQSLPQTLMQIPGQVGEAVKTQATNFIKAPFEGRSPLLDAQVAATSKGMDSLIGLGQGLFNLPGDVQNAYMGRNMTAPTQFAKTSQIPQIQQAQQRNPVAGFIGEQVPYALPFMQATRAKYLPSIIEGAGIGGVMEPEGPNRLQARLGNAVAGGALPAGLGAVSRVMRGQPLKAPPVAPPARPVNPYANRTVNISPELVSQLSDARKLQGKITQRQEMIKNQLSVTEQKTLQDKLTKQAQLFRQLDDMERVSPPVVADRVGKLKAQAKAEYDRLLAEKETKFPSRKPQQVKTLKPEQFQTVVNLGVKAHKSGGATRAKFKATLKKYNTNDQYKVNKGIENALKAEKTRAQTEKARAELRRENAKQRRANENKSLMEAAEKEAAELKKQFDAEKARRDAQKAQEKRDKSGRDILQAVIEATEEAKPKAGTATELVASGKDEYSRMAQEAKSTPKAPKAESEKPKKEGKAADEVLDILESISKKPEPKSTANELRAAGPDEYKRMAQEAKTAPKPQQKGPGGAQSKQSILTQAMFAKNNRLELRLEYEAEGGKSGVGGERESSTYRFKRDVVLDVRQNKSGDIILTTINENGQKTTRHLHEPMSGSRIYSAKVTGKPAKYAMQDGEIYNLETGDVVPQTKEAGTFSSDIRENVEKIENFDRVMRKYQKKQAKVGDLIKTARDIPDTDLEKAYSGEQKAQTKQQDGPAEQNPQAEPERATRKAEPEQGQKAINPMKGKKQTIYIAATEGGKKPVEAMVYGEVAIFKQPPGGKASNKKPLYNLTHAETGLNLAFFETAGEAKLTAYHLNNTPGVSMKFKNAADLTVEQRKAIAQIVMKGKVGELPPIETKAPLSDNESVRKNVHQDITGEPC